MRLSRASRTVAACLALIGMLFMQLAIAAYVCPDSRDRVETMSASSMASMPGCDGVDKVQPTLCHAQAHTPDSSFNAPELPSVHPFVAAQAIPVATAIDAFSFSEVYPAPIAFLKRTTAPPIAIRHCCFRI